MFGPMDLSYLPNGNAQALIGVIRALILQVKPFKMHSACYEHTKGGQINLKD
jgi:hypothetical protein